MAPNIHELSEKRKKWIEANRENGFEDGIKLLLIDLYPDSAHFIFELLQNAEDAGASTVRFILNNESVEFEHNGDRLFSIEDVDSITSIGVSTKKDDLTSIGKFGVGFKAVFAYTTTPEIESGEFHFRIRDLVMPDTDGLSPCALGEKETRIVIPFNNPRKPREKAREEIERNLLQINESTLLFLCNIRKIEYVLPNSSMGFLERSESDDNSITISVQHPDESTPTSTVFLRFDKEVSVNDEDGNPKPCRISIAFSMEKNEDHGKKRLGNQETLDTPSHWRIRPLIPGQVSIYFPAEKETSNLLFHIHAPFASTVARDSVRACSSNNELRDHLVNLVAESMTTIRDKGLLTVGFLETLPNGKDNLPSFYKPIQNRLIEVFQDENLTPMRKGGHAAASGIFRGTAQLSNLINDDDLATIMGEDFFSPMWVANPPQRNQREDSFLASLEISEWTTEDLVSAFKSNADQMEALLRCKSDEWHQGLYALLSEYNYSSAASNYHAMQMHNNLMKSLRIVRTSDGNYRTGSECYFPDAGVEHDTLMPRVVRGVYSSGKSEEQQKKAMDFLGKIGVREVGEVEQVEAILKDRYSQAATDRDSFRPRIKDIKRFIALVGKYPSTASLFDDYFIFKRIDELWAMPRQVYLDSPFKQTRLSAYYDALQDKTSPIALSSEYEKCGLDITLLARFAESVGVNCTLPIIPTTCYKNPKWQYLCDVAGKRTNNSINSDYVIKDIDQLLKSPSLALSQLIWQTMRDIDKRCLKAIYRNNWSSGDRQADSQLVHIIKSVAWIPQTSRDDDQLKYVRPADADSRLLPTGFTFDRGWDWVSAVFFGSAVNQREESVRIAALRKTSEYKHEEEVVKKLGFESTEEAKEIAELKRKDPAGYINWQASNKEKPHFPNAAVANIDRRQERLADQIADAPEKEYVNRERSIRITRGTVDPNYWLRNKYTNQAAEMVCQICREEMPFKKRNGEYYFEAVEALSSDYFCKEHEAQYLALCPVCAAMYNEFVKFDKGPMEDLSHAIKHSAGSEVPLHLGEVKVSIRFVESHFSDIKTILSANE
jgi:hypothetical protein